MVDQGETVGAATVALGVAATVVLLRDAVYGPEVLLLERPRHRGSFAGAWVFPGGAVDPQDRLAVAGEGASTGGEEPGVRRAAVREVWEETGLRLSECALVSSSCWVPPAGIPKRMRTWFFLARDPGGTLALAADECIDAEWMRPSAALQRHATGVFTLVSPTWVTLHGLVGHGSVDQILAAQRAQPPRLFTSRMGGTGAGLTVFWEGDVASADDRRMDDAGGRHRLTIGALPWVYERS
ncbi:MAG: NUDIX hydrolase [Cryobacterium sp.]